ncbi:MAG: hypothetical protein ACUVWP_07700 [bacterium]
MNIVGKIRGLVRALLMDRGNGSRISVLSRRKQILTSQEEVPLSAFRRMRNDPQVQAGLSVIKLPILAQTFSIDGPVEISETVEKAIKNYIL